MVGKLRGLDPIGLVDLLCPRRQNEGKGWDGDLEEKATGEGERMALSNETGEWARRYVEGKGGSRGRGEKARGKPDGAGKKAGARYDRSNRVPDGTIDR